MAVPHSVAAQTCTGTDGTPPEFALGSSDTGAIACTGLTGGLTLNLNGAVLGTSETHLTGGALSITATTGGARDVVVTGRIATYSQGTGIGMGRAGTGLLKLVLDEKSIITTSGAGGVGINLKHTGEAGKETSIHLESSATIDVSKSTNETRAGISVTTAEAAAGTTIPITVHLKGGSIRAEDAVGNYKQGHGVDVLQFAKGDITITVDPGVMIGLDGKSIGTHGIRANIKPAGVGKIAITHRGEIYATHGIYAFVEGYSGSEDEIKGDIVIETGADSKIVTKLIPFIDSKAYPYGIQALNNGDKRIGDIKITHKGMIKADGYGIEAKGNRDVTITTMTGSSITAKEKGINVDAKGNIMITHSGSIHADGDAIYASLPRSESPAEGNIAIKTGADSAIETDGYGIVAYLNPGRTGTITIIHRGKITAGAQAGIHAQGYKAVSITMEASSRITATEIGLRARAYAGATATVETKEGSVITADHYGIMVDKRGSAVDKFALTIRGTVMGGDSACTNTKTNQNICAGVRIRRSTIVALGANEKGGGTIVIGPRAHVKAKSGVAIEVDPKYDDDQAEVVAVILEKDEAGVVGHVEGKILNRVSAAQDIEEENKERTRSTLAFKTRSASGTENDLKVNDHVYRRGDRMGVYEQVFKAQLEKITDGYQFEDDPSAPVLRLYSHRARLYEVLPSVLLGLVELTPYSTRMAVPRRTTGDEEVMVESSKGEHVVTPSSRTGVWVRLAVRDGERMADTSTTATDFWRQSLAWDVKQTDFEAGLEVPTDERLVLGVSAHYRQSEATVKRGGTMEANGTGVGVSLTWTGDDGLYVDGQLSYTRFFDITMVSANGAVGAITSTGGGNGLALGVEVGQPMSMGGLTVIPRGGLSWSSVDMDAFDEPATIDGAGRVAPDKEQSVQGRVGVLAELGSGEADRRLYASLDLEHEFSSKHAVMVAGTRLATEVKPTWVRLGVGGAMSLGGHDTTLLTGDAFYATAGSDNTDFGGGLSVTFRF